MLKLTIAGNGKTLTLYVANNAFDGVEPPVLQEEQVIILKKLASKMIRNAKLIVDGTAETIYLREIKFNEADAKLLYFKQSDKYAIAQSPNAANIRNQEPAQLDGYKTTVEIINDTPEDILLIERRMLVNNAHPPINIADSVANVRVLQGDDYERESKEAVKTILLKNGEDEITAETKASLILSNVRETLNQAKDARLGSIPEEMHDNLQARLEILNEFLNEKCINIEKGRKIIHDRINEYLVSEFDRRTLIQNLAVALHNAAKDYYVSRWEANRGNDEKLHQERLAFNGLFQGIAEINDDFNLTPATVTTQSFLNQTPAQLQELISVLLNKTSTTIFNTVKPFDAFHFIKPRLRSLNEEFNDELFTPFDRQKIWGYNFQFSKTSMATFDAYSAARENIDAISYRGLQNIYADIEHAKISITKDATNIQEEYRKILRPKPALVPTAEANPAAAPAAPRASFWQRNKAKIISITVGVLVAAAIGVGLFFALPIIAPSLATTAFVAGIIAGAAVVAIVVSAIIGRVVDKFRARKQQREAADTEAASLLHQDKLDTPPPSPPTLRTTAQLARATDGISGLSFGPGKPGPMFSKKSDQTSNTKSVTAADDRRPHNNNVSK